MYELVQAGEQSYYINCPAKIGVFVANDTEVYLIDSGSDKDAGRKVLKVLEQKGWSLKAIVNTHSNADHIGGNRFLQQRTGCQIFASGIEAAFANYPILEPAFLYGGFPCDDLRHKFLLAAESNVLDVSHKDFPKELEIIPLPGHFFHMIGIRTPDNTVFLADCLSSAETLEKYQIAFVYEVEKYLSTLERVGAMQANMFVPSHADAGEGIGELVRLNIAKVHETADKILDVCRQPMNFEHILQKLFQDFELQMNFEQYVLVGSTIRSYLSWLKDTGKLSVSFEQSLLLWRAVE